MIHDESGRNAAEDPASVQEASKTQRKRESHELQELGVALVSLRHEQLQRIELPDEVRDAVEFAHRVTSHEARRRHFQYLGKLMRQLDAQQVREAISRVTGGSRAAIALMHQAERWRDRLLDDDAALTAFVAEHPAADIQWLRTTIRAARREQVATKPPRHARELYRRVHDLLESGAAT